jgi:hypothetical protein
LGRYLADLFQPEAVEARDRMMYARLRTLGIKPGRSIGFFELQGLCTPRRQERR